MERSRSPIGKYLLIALLGAGVGGIAVAVAGRVIPKAVSGIMSSMMGRMMDQMGAEGCNPEEM